jgi:hypothetical protein
MRFIDSIINIIQTQQINYQLSTKEAARNTFIFSTKLVNGLLSVKYNYDSKYQLNDHYVYIVLVVYL